MAKRYARLNWNSTSTYVSASNLNVMDKGIDDCDNAIEVLNDGLKAVNNNLKISTLPASTTLASLISVVPLNETRKYLYNTDALPSDYPTTMSQASNTFIPLVTVYRFGGIMYIEITSPNQTTGIPKTVKGYYNGNFYWSSIIG